MDDKGVKKQKADLALIQVRQSPKKAYFGGLAVITFWY
jgi:hypothetical protein